MLMPSFYFSVSGNNLDCGRGITLSNVHGSVAINEGATSFLRGLMARGLGPAWEETLTARASPPRRLHHPVRE